MSQDNSSLPFDSGEPDITGLLTDLRHLIGETRERAAIAINRELTLMHWHVGDRIRKDILQAERAAYGERIVQSLAGQLTAEFGRGFSAKTLRHMMHFAEVFPDLQIVSSMMRQLTWTHCLELIYIKDRLKREFYAEMCRLEKWSVRALRAKIAGMLFERTTLSGKAGLSAPGSSTAPLAISREAMDAMLARNGLKAQNVMLTGDFAKIQLASVSFASTLHSLDDMQKNALLFVVDANIVALAQPDMVNAIFTLHQQRNE